MCEQSEGSLVPLVAWRVLMAAVFLLTVRQGISAAPVPSAEFAFILVLYSVGRHSPRHLVLTVGLLTALLPDIEGASRRAETAATARA